MSDSLYIVGIDLGTTNSAVAYTAAHEEENSEAEIHILPIPQLVDAGRVESRSLLPSFLFIPGPHDAAGNSLELPWGSSEGGVVGEFARERGAEIPARLVSSAKSWLCHTGVDRNRPILPWQGDEDVPKLSPVEVSSAFLEHVRRAWNHVIAQGDTSKALEYQEIFLTVPASFDAVARELTVQAAQRAGLPKVVLLEEPQSAFYAWLDAERQTWREQVRSGDRILVCDIGGGTTDFSLIRVGDDHGRLTLERVAVGDHVLVGGENMDLALAYFMKEKLEQGKTTLDSWQMRQLMHRCRQAKENLFLNSEIPSAPISILGRGKGLIAGTIRSDLTREELESVLVEGFFPACSPSDVPRKSRRGGMRELGLPYAEDPGVTRYLAKFLAESADPEKEGSSVRPTAVLFNGGVMKGQSLRRKLLDVLVSWSGGQEDGGLRELKSGDPDHAVARGAAYYGLVRRGRGIRIRSGAERTYYIGVETSMPAVPGVPAPLRALCVAPFGMEEGTELSVPQREFGLVVGETVEFHFLGSTVRKGDVLGDVIDILDDEIQDITTLETHLEALSDEGGAVVPVTLEVWFTEIGTLEIWCAAENRSQEWKLEFNVREQRPRAS